MFVFCRIVEYFVYMFVDIGLFKLLLFKDFYDSLDIMNVIFEKINIKLLIVNSMEINVFGEFMFFLIIGSKEYI